MELYEIRVNNRLTQAQAAAIVGMPLRTYARYESSSEYGNALKREKMIEILNSKFEINEEKGILSLDKIKEIVSKTISSNYGKTVEFCYLFGSYAKGYAKDNSDVDLCVSTEMTGLKFVGLKEALRVALNKKVDLIRLSDLNDNIQLVNEIMKDGIKIYG